MGIHSLYYLYENIVILCTSRYICTFNVTFVGKFVCQNKTRPCYQYTFGGGAVRCLAVKQRPVLKRSFAIDKYVTRATTYIVIMLLHSDPYALKV